MNDIFDRILAAVAIIAGMAIGQLIAQALRPELMIRYPRLPLQFDVNALVGLTTRVFWQVFMCVIPHDLTRPP